MGLPKQPGWYCDPNGSVGVLRYWDGDTWTKMTRMEAAAEGSSTSKAAVADEPPQHSVGKMRTAKMLLVLSSGFVNLARLIGALFVVAALASVFTPVGQMKIGGMPVITIASYLALAAVISALAAAIAATPMRNFCLNAVMGFVVDLTWAVELQTLKSMNAPASEYERAAGEVRFTKAVASALLNSAAVGSVLSGIVALFVHNWMLDIVGEPWTALLTLSTIPVFGLLFGMTVVPLATGKYRRGNPALYQVTADMIRRGRAGER